MLHVISNTKSKGCMFAHIKGRTQLFYANCVEAKKTYVFAEIFVYIRWLFLPVNLIHRLLNFDLKLS